MSNENWISCEKNKLPPLYIVSKNNYSTTYRSEKVLVQTKREEMFVAYCKKECFTNKRYDDEIAWFANGTGGRKNEGDEYSCLLGWNYLRNIKANRLLDEIR